MVKRIFLKMNDIKVSAMMITVTGNTGFSLGFGGHVETLLPGNPFLYLCMAFQTLFVGHFRSQGMTFGAVGNPLDMGMNCCKIPRRNLTKCRAWQPA